MNSYQTRTKCNVWSTGSVWLMGDKKWIHSLSMLLEQLRDSSFISHVDFFLHINILFSFAISWCWLLITCRTRFRYDHAYPSEYNAIQRGKFSEALFCSDDDWDWMFLNSRELKKFAVFLSTFWIGISFWELCIPRQFSDWWIATSDLKMMFSILDDIFKSGVCQIFRGIRGDTKERSL